MINLLKDNFKNKVIYVYYRDNNTKKINSKIIGNIQNIRASTCILYIEYLNKYKSLIEWSQIKEKIIKIKVTDKNCKKSVKKL